MQSVISKNNNTKQWGVLLLVLLLSVFFGASKAYAFPSSGTVIDSQAYATYFSVAEGTYARIDSNTVVATVLAKESMSLTADQTGEFVPAAFVEFSHQLTNIGNVSSDFVINYQNLAGDDFDFATLTVYRDVTGNGVIDSTDIVIADGDSISLNPGETTSLIISTVVPSSAAFGSSAQIRISATSTVDGETTFDTDTVIVASGALIDLNKQVSDVNAQPGDSVTYTIDATNIGAADAEGIPVIIDGANLSRVLIFDVMPVNTSFVSLSSSGGQVLYRLFGMAENEYTLTPPADLTQVIRVAIGELTFPVGQSLTAYLSVSVNEVASGLATNIAGAGYTSNGVEVSAESNSVTTDLGDLPAEILFLDSTYNTELPVMSVGDDAYIQAHAAACNADAERIETRRVIVVSENTQDTETYLAQETGPNTAVFRLPPIPTGDASNGIVLGNGIVEITADDSLVATLEDCAAAVLDTILIDPSGVVYDSRNNTLIEGTVVRLINSDTGQLAEVFASDGVTPAPSEITTGIDGVFEFPLVAQGTYRVEVIVPEGSGYRFASILAPDLQPPDRVINATGSYGQDFEVSLATGPVVFDIPLDPLIAPGLLALQKQASKTYAEVGDFVDYTITVTNNSNHFLPNNTVIDLLPAGFSYETGTLRYAVPLIIEGVPITDPINVTGSSFTVLLGSMAVGEQRIYSYRVRIKNLAISGDGINKAQATSFLTQGDTAVSNVATARVIVQAGVFSDEGFIIGKIYTDCNQNRTQEPDELGVPGVRLFMQDGTSVISDAEGKYSFYGVSPTTHVLKVDSITLPVGAQLMTLDNRNAGVGDSRFVDLKKGELHKADFALTCRTESVLEEVSLRRQQGEVFVAELDKSVKNALTINTVNNTVDVRNLPASGLKDKQDEPFQALMLKNRLANTGLGNYPEHAVARTPSAEFDTLLHVLDSSLGFIDLKDGDTLPNTQANIRIKGKLGASLRLTLNDEVVSEERVGQKSSLPRNEVEAWEYIGVDLQPGENLLTLEQVDSFGNVRGSEKITLIAPDSLTTLEVSFENDTIADGVTPVLVKVALVDKDGVPVTVRTPLNLETNIGRWDVEDINDDEPGVQVFIQGGIAHFKLLPPDVPADGSLLISSGIIEHEQEIKFKPFLRPMLAVGLIEGVLNLRKLDTNALSPAREQDGFERELRELSAELGDGKRQLAARAAFFLKGKVKGEYLLTMAFDSEKSTEEKLFRDIQPDQFYPVYGDSSVRGFDAQSTGRLYVRVDKERSYLLLGDYSTSTKDEVRQLSRYIRSFNGVQNHLENSRGVVNSFVSNDDHKQVIEEIRGQGISGPYQIGNTNIRPNSERVELITRDRDQPGVILSIVPMRRFTDYSLEPFSGTLLFTKPVSSLDSEFNEVFIRVSYEVEGEGDKYWVAGVDARYKVTDKVQVGAAYISDQNPADEFNLSTLNAATKIGQNTLVSAEIAHTTHDRLDQASTDGMGARVELKHNGEKLNAQAYVTDTDEGFDNPNAPLNKGRSEAAVKLDYALNNKTSLKAEAVHNDDVLNNSQRSGGMLSVSRRFDNNSSIELAARTSEDTRNDVTSESETVLVKVASQVPNLSKATMSAEWEQDIDVSDNKRLTVGGDYQISERSRFYAKHELANTLGSVYSLNGTTERNATVVGFDSEYLRDANLFSEYRLRDSFSGRDAEAALGLRNTWTLKEGVRLNTNFERVASLEGLGNNEQTAMGAGLDYTANPNWKASARLELRNATSGDSVLSSLSYANKLNRDLTFLAKNIYSLNQFTDRGDKLQERMQLGLAWRETDTNQWNVLGRYEFRYEKDDSLTESRSKRDAHILSTHINYEPSHSLLFSGRVATKWVNEIANDIESDYAAYLLAGRATYDITDRWDISAALSSHFDASSHQLGVGVEAGYMLGSNMWLSAGYNFTGYKDDELVGEEYTNPGVFMRFRYKFDETLFGRSDSKE